MEWWDEPDGPTHEASLLTRYPSRFDKASPSTNVSQHHDASLPRSKKPRTKAGAEIDRQTEEALAAEAERGYDLDKAKRRRVGRNQAARGV